MDLRTTYLRLVSDVRTLLRPGADLQVQVGPPGPVDLRLVGEVARLHLTARRCGARLVVQDVGGALDELLGLAGLLRGQPHGQAEVLEELGPDEVVHVADPAP